MSDQKKQTPAPAQPPSVERLKRNPPVTDHKTLDQGGGRSRSDTTVFRTRPVPDPGKK